MVAKTPYLKGGAWERSILMYRTSLVKYALAKKGRSKPLLWISHGRTDASVFVPLIMDVDTDDK